MEDQLWNAIRRHDRDAFTEMYKAYYQFLFSYGIRINGDKDRTKDAIHELFLEIWKNRETLPEVQHIGYYLRTILQRKIARQMAREEIRPLDEVMAGHPGDIEYSYEELLIRLQSSEELHIKMQRAIRALTRKQIAVIRMKFFEDKSYEEIARLTATTPRTIYNQVYESLRTLRKYLSLLF